MILQEQSAPLPKIRIFLLKEKKQHSLKSNAKSIFENSRETL
jgi:hypothetical protein